MNMINYQICSCGVKRKRQLDYTIEEHLKQFRDDDNYKVLYECWELEKKEYENRLKVVGIRYQTYSQHDATHSEAILRQIACFLGEERIRQLSPTDAWLLLECAYCHDIGMVVKAKELFDEFAALDVAEFEKWSESMYNSSNDDIKLAWGYLEPLFRYGEEIKSGQGIDEWSEKEYRNIQKYNNIESLKKIFDSKWYEWPLYFTQAFMIIIQEYSRSRHAQMSYDKIIDEAGEKEYEGIIPLRLRYLVAEIARMHTAEKGEVLKRLERTVQGIFIDQAHPRFVAELLRIGDLLDIDNNRFNKYQLAVSGNPSYNSVAHQLKHRALRDFLVTPEKIVVHADFNISYAEKLLSEDSIWKIFCDQIDEAKGKQIEEKSVELTVRAFKEMSAWLDMLRKELEFLSVKWFVIIPDGFEGSCAIFDDEQLLIDGETIDAALLNLRYHITARRASEIIEGSGLYDNIFKAFIREILQNSMDAVKRAVYKNLLNSGADMKDFQNPLSLYRYISRNLQQIRIEISCENDTENDDGVILKIRDRGIGISYDRLQGMQHIGNMIDIRSKIQADKMPRCWKPTGSFGIGMQTIFYFAKEFKLKTRTVDEKLLRKMRFHSTQMGGKIDTYFVKDAEKEEFGYGTEIEIHISDQMMEAVQEKGFWGTKIDFFGERKKLYQNQIAKVLEEISGSFGIPVLFDGKYFSGQSLERCFGNCFIDIRNNDVKMVKESFNKDEVEVDGFSCWDAENRILIRYKCLEKRKKRPVFKIYVNEILVNAYPLTKFFAIDFWEAEVYIFSDHVDDLIEINRERFLNEKLQFISRKICKTHLKCMTILLGDALEEQYHKMIWSDPFYEDVKKYYCFLLLGQRFMATNIGIKCYIRENKLLRHIEEYDIDYMNKEEGENGIGAGINDYVWLMDMRYRFFTDLRLKKADKQVYCITEDVLYGYLNLAICEIKVLEQLHDDRLILYRTTDRSGMPVKMSKECLRMYLLQRFYVDKSSRLILPGIEEYREISVAKLIGSLGTDFEKRFDSAIIFPLSSDELKELLKIEESLSVKKYLGDEVFIEHNYSYRSIVNYIERYSCNSNGKFDLEVVKDQHRKLVMFIWNVLKKWELEL